MQSARRAWPVQSKGDDIGGHSRRDLPNIIPPEHGGAATGRHLQRLAGGQRGRIAQGAR